MGNEEKRQYLIDVPVLIYIWVRPELQRMQFEVIKQARPSKLFLISDGGRNESEWDAIKQNRRMYDEIDWKCTVYRLFKDENIGMYGMMKETYDYVFGKVDRIIALEDDTLPTVSFLKFCADLLERYKNDERICMICGLNHENISKQVPYDYFFSTVGSGWGVAIWKRSFDKYFDFYFKQDKYTQRLLNDYLKRDKSFRRIVNGYIRDEYYGGHVAGMEFFNRMCIYGHHQLMIIPQKSLVSYCGCTKDAAHSMEYKLLPKGIRTIFNASSYEINFPLKHPRYMIPDLRYERKRNWIMGYNHPLLSFVRKLEIWVLRCKYGEFLYYFKRAVNRVLTKQKER